MAYARFVKSICLPSFIPLHSLVFPICMLMPKKQDDDDEGTTHSIPVF